MEEKQRYLRWLGILCAVMAAFCLGVFAIGYKDPSAGRVATLVGLIVASAGFFWLGRRKTPIAKAPDLMDGRQDGSC